MIAEQSIQEVFDTAQIEEVIADFVNLKRRGSNLVGLCPFHTENTPSFTVSPSKEIYKCFGCGAGGNVVQFLMEHEQYSYPEAIRYLADRYNIELEETGESRENDEDRQLKESLFIVNDFAREFYIKTLKETSAGGIGRSYFKERGYNEQTIDQYELGYAPSDNNALQQAAKANNYKPEHLKTLGLVSKHGRDFFRDRVIFPIRNLSGKVIAFAGRTLKDSKAPKYINSPESPIYNKSEALYGIHLAKNEIRKNDNCLLVEGYTDVLSLYQSGIKHVVAASGTSLTSGQVRLVKRFTENITMIFDGDEAGINAAMRGLDIVLEEDMNIRIGVLPEDEDPDSFLRSVGSNKFREWVEEKPQDFIFFKIDRLVKQHENDPVERSKGIESITDSLAHIPDRLRRSLYIKECARLLDIEESILHNEVNKALKQKLWRKRKKIQREERRQLREESDQSGQDSPETGTPKSSAQTVVSGDEMQEKDLVRILFQAGDKLFDAEDEITVAEYIIYNIQDVIDSLDNPIYKQIIEEYKDCVEQGKNIPNLKDFTRHENKEIQQLAVDIGSEEYEYSSNWEEKYHITLQTQPLPEQNFEEDSHQALLRFKLKKVRKMIQENNKMIERYTKNENSEEVERHMKIHMQLMKTRNEIADQLNTIVL